MIELAALKDFKNLLFVGRKGDRLHWMAIALAVLHPILTFGLFYSLAIHMHHSLDGWPLVLGYQGFSPALARHADISLFAFGTLIAGCIFALPVAVLLCACLPKMRPGFRYLGIYALASVAVFGCMMLAPDPFLYWLWD